MALLFFLFWLVLNGKVTLEIAAFGAAVTVLAVLVKEDTVHRL